MSDYIDYTTALTVFPSVTPLRVCHLAAEFWHSQ